MLKIKGKYSEDINRTKNHLAIKDKLQKLGHTNIEVWYERPCGSIEMEGIQGGYFFTSDQNELEPLGMSLEESLQYLDNSWFLVEKI